MAVVNHGNLWGAGLIFTPTISRNKYVGNSGPLCLTCSLGGRHDSPCVLPAPLEAGMTPLVSYLPLEAGMTPLMSMPSSVRVPVLSKHTSLILPHRFTL